MASLQSTVLLNLECPKGLCWVLFYFLSTMSNDLEKDIKSRVKFFADDTMIYSVVRDAQLSAVELNHDLKIISKWAHQWKMVFNPDPTKQATEVLFSNKKREG